MQIRTLLNGKGLKTEAGAVERLTRAADMLGQATRFVVCQDGEFFPVVVYAERHTLNIPAICTAGIHVVN